MQAPIIQQSAAGYLITQPAGAAPSAEVGKITRMAPNVLSAEATLIIQAQMIIPQPSVAENPIAAKAIGALLEVVNKTPRMVSGQQLREVSIISRIMVVLWAQASEIQPQIYQAS
jgi:hypothetical protein